MPSVAILGSGEVGMACAGPLLGYGLASRLTFYDRTGDRARGEALDFAHASALLPECVVEGASLEEARPADIAVLTTGTHSTRIWRRSRRWPTRSTKHSRRS